MKDILVHLDDSDRCRVRLALAIGLARRFGARLTGLFARVDSFTPGVVAHQASDFLIAARDVVRAAFEAAVAAAGIDGRWWQLAHGEPGHVLGETTFCARFADLVVMGQAEPKSSLVPDDLVEHVILNSGRPVLVVPHSGTFATLGERVAVAWNASREAARALADSLPLLAGAMSVTVLSLRGGHEDVRTLPEVPHVDIVDHLAIWGIKANSEHLSGEQIGKMDMLLSRLCDLGADLVVMGAQSPGALSLKRGSGTHYVLSHMTVPVLMAH
ncbi:universal stress protein [Magnetospirillum molischianum]|uniref:Universal stress protein UspA and related nucleotide-binding protein n=1 Tax=Magnetospirillum molischianum DSM 120 TaxID=1150626 RepID=H8FN80_MAGML|nr:universal stress protein [Magnetospirillum molischianum]CCG39818.1 Universal stress protein UspA and related nucleotide-binding protein [Magnetospirillum molischianum DSM 120]